MNLVPLEGVRHCDYGPILHRFWDTATYLLKLPIFATPVSHTAPSLPVFPLEFRGEVNRQETIVMGLSSSEDRMIVAWLIFDMIPDCDRRMDRWMDGRNLS